MMDEENDMREKSGMREDDDFWEFASTLQTRRRGILLCHYYKSLASRRRDCIDFQNEENK